MKKNETESASTARVLGRSEFLRCVNIAHSASVALCQLETKKYLFDSLLSFRFVIPLSKSQHASNRRQRDIFTFIIA